MEIRIGIVNSRELSFETDQTGEEITRVVVDALDSGASHVSVRDAKGATYLIPTATIGFVEIGAEETRRVGFVA